MEYPDKFKEAKKIQDLTAKILIIMMALLCLSLIVIVWLHSSKSTPQDYCNEVYGEKSQISYYSHTLYSCLIIKNNKIENYYFTKQEYNVWLKGKEK